MARCPLYTRAPALGPRGFECYAVAVWGLLSSILHKLSGNNYYGQYSYPNRQSHCALHFLWRLYLLANLIAQPALPQSPHGNVGTANLQEIASRHLYWRADELTG